MSHNRGKICVHHHPPYQHKVNIYKKLSGSLGGIFEGVYYDAPLHPGKARMATVSADIPHYHRLLLSHPDRSVNYHLSGYGLTKHEALIRLAGESVERYAGVIAQHSYREQSVRASLQQLRQEGKDALHEPWFDIYAPEQRQQLAQRSARSHASVNDQTPILWSPCQRYFSAQKKIWVPQQYLYTTAVEDEPLITVPVSTGTASHRDLAPAMLASLLEYIQIHFFNLVWYGGLPAHRIEGRGVLLERLYHDLALEEDYQLDSYYCNASQPQLPAVICTLLRHRRQQEPYLLCGLQCDFRLEKAMLRSALEAHAIVYSGLYQGIEGRYPDTETWVTNDFVDLDSNVLHYCRAHLAEAHRRTFSFWDESSPLAFEDLHLCYQELGSLTRVEQQLSFLLARLPALCPNACYQVITPPELVPQGWHVVRTFIPEFLPICPPGYPPLHHPAYHRWAQGVMRHAPHPLP